MSTVEDISTIPSVGSNDSASVEFNDYANDYEVALHQGLQVTGEQPQYFARGRVEWTAKLLRRQSVKVDSVLDFGCGVGIAAPLFHEFFQPHTVWGFDPSRSSIERAKRDEPGPANRFVASREQLPAGECDLVYTNGVFHHIPPGERATALAMIWQVLRPGGWLAFWENNPWNPGTRLVMSRIPFDRDAVTITPYGAKTLLRSAGFNTIRTDAWFLFPHALRALRPLEWWVHRLPLGAQYLVLAQKPLINERQ